MPIAFCSSSELTIRYTYAAINVDRFVGLEDPGLALLDLNLFLELDNGLLQLG